MFNYKLILLICLAAPCIFSLTPKQNEVAVNMESQVMASQDSAEKINWDPVRDDLQVHKEFVTWRQDVNDTENCDAPNGLGLKNLFQQIEKILPKQQIKNIVESYAENNEIKALKAYINSPETKKKVKAIRNSAEYQILKDYTCRVLHIDLLQYNKLTRTLLNPSLQRANNQECTEICGLINAINAVLPHQKIHDLYQNLLSSDEELVKAVANLKSDEFHQLLWNVKNNVPEYKELCKELNALGVPVEKMRELIAKTLGLTSEVNLFV